MLVRNKLISPEDRMRLRQWIAILESMMLSLLHGRKPYDFDSRVLRLCGRTRLGTKLPLFRSRCYQLQSTMMTLEIDSKAIARL